MALKEKEEEEKAEKTLARQHRAGNSSCLLCLFYTVFNVWCCILQMALASAVCMYHVPTILLIPEHHSNCTQQQRKEKQLLLLDMCTCQHLVCYLFLAQHVFIISCYPHYFGMALNAWFLFSQCDTLAVILE